MRESWKKLGDLLPDAYCEVGVAIEVDFDPTGKFGRYMDRRLRQLVKRMERRWPCHRTMSGDRPVQQLPDAHDASQQDSV